MKKIQLNHNGILYPFNLKGKESIIYMYNDSSYYTHDVLLKYFRDEYTEKAIEKWYKTTKDFDEYMACKSDALPIGALINKEKKIN